MDPTCPTCGYDQSGLIATWDTSCPLAGTCTECGSELDFVEMLHTKPIRFWWYAEHARGAVSFVWLIPISLIVLLDPGRFWARWDHRQVKHARRFVWFVIGACAVLHLLASIPGVFAAHEEFGGYSWWRTLKLSDPGWVPLLALDVLNGMLFPYTNLGRWSVGSLAGWSPYSWQEMVFVMPPLVGIPIVWVVSCLVVPSVRERVLARRWIFWRVGMISVVPLVAAQEVMRAYKAFQSLYWNIDDVVTVLTIAISIALCMFWQNAIWAHCVSRAFRVRGSFVFNMWTIGASLVGAFGAQAVFMAIVF